MKHRVCVYCSWFGSVALLFNLRAQCRSGMSQCPCLGHCGANSIRFKSYAHYICLHMIIVKNTLARLQIQHAASLSTHTLTHTGNVK